MVVDPKFGPYGQAVQFIRLNPGTGGTNGLSKLILSLWNEEAAYSLRECLRSLDDERTVWAQKIITHFIKHGEDEYLVLAGHEVNRLNERLWDIGYAGNEAKDRKRRELFNQ